MQTKIYEKIKQDKLKYLNSKIKKFGILDNNNEINSIIPKENLDLNVLISKLDFVDEDIDLYSEINEFYDYLFELGIECGMTMGVKLLLQSIQNNTEEPDELMKMNLEDIVDCEMIESLINEN